MSKYFFQGTKVPQTAWKVDRWLNTRTTHRYGSKTLDLGTGKLTVGSSETSQRAHSLLESSCYFTFQNIYQIPPQQYQPMCNSSQIITTFPHESSVKEALDDHVILWGSALQVLFSWVPCNQAGIHIYIHPEQPICIPHHSWLDPLFSSSNWNHTKSAGL